VIEASVWTLVLKVEIVDFAQHQEKMRASTNRRFEDAVEYPKEIKLLLENP
jgi:hypothetical protein